MTIRASICCLLLGLLAGCASQDAVQASRQHLQRGNVFLAYRTIEDARDELQASGAAVDPDSDLEKCYQDTRILFLLSQARQAMYANDEDEAIRLLQVVQADRPENRRAKELMVRARHKKAVRLTNEGDVHLAGGDLFQALSSYELALKEDADYQLAHDGLDKVNAAITKLTGEAQRQFLDAMRKLPEFRYNESSYHAGVALLRDVKGDVHEGAEEVRQKARQALAESAQQRADKSKAKGAYGAALMGYREAQMLWPEQPNVDANIKAMEREVQAQAKLDAANMAVRTGKFDDVDRLLKEALELSQLERGTINDLMFESRKRIGMRAYDKARDLEIQGMKVEALAAFEAVSKDWPDGLSDEKTRIGSLQADIKGYQQALAEGEAAEQKNDLKMALDHYKAAQTYYARNKDLAARIARVQAAIAKAGS